MVATLRVTSRFHGASNLTMRTLAAAIAAALVGWLLHSTPCPTSSGGQAPSPVHMNGNERTGEAPVLHWKNDDVTVSTAAKSLRIRREHSSRSRARCTNQILRCAQDQVNRSPSD